MIAKSFRKELREVKLTYKFATDDADGLAEKILEVTARCWHLHIFVAEPRPDIARHDQFFEFDRIFLACKSDIQLVSATSVVRIFQNGLCRAKDIFPAHPSGGNGEIRSCGQVIEAYPFYSLHVKGFKASCYISTVYISHTVKMSLYHGLSPFLSSFRLKSF